ncbi:uncharacterized protein LOC142767186 [Rhipicephalus microplus]|uniref:uncharacterized protein LOC142767186 n=1 Tax=Rhipicephalus microplus TaxID=6941 RepID=UPI003F6AD335
MFHNGKFELFVSSGLLHVTNWSAREASAAIISCQCFLVRKHVVVAGRDTWPTGSACRLVEDRRANVKRFKHFVCTSRREPAAGGAQHFLGSSTGRGFALKRYSSAKLRTRAPRATPSHLPQYRRRSLWRTCYRHCIESSVFIHPHLGSEDRLVAVLMALPQL